MHSPSKESTDVSLRRARLVVATFADTQELRATDALGLAQARLLTAVGARPLRPRLEVRAGLPSAQIIKTASWAKEGKGAGEGSSTRLGSLGTLSIHRLPWDGNAHAQGPRGQHKHACLQVLTHGGFKAPTQRKESQRDVPPPSPHCSSREGHPPPLWGNRSPYVEARYSCPRCRARSHPMAECGREWPL